MASVAQKARTLLLSNIHTLLDKAINLNKIGEVEQRVRDLQTARDQLDDQAAASKADVLRLPREIASLESRHEEADENINILLKSSNPGDDHLAAPLEAQMVALEGQIALKKELLGNAQAAEKEFSDAVGKLDIQLVNVQARLETLRQLETTAKGKESAAKLLSGVRVTEQPDVDSVEADLRRRAGVADNALSREIGRVTGPGGSTIESTVAARLAARREQLTAAEPKVAAAQ